MTTPLLLLDVDGVLNALPHHDEQLGAWRDWRDGYAAADGTRWPITWAPSAIDCLRDWHVSGLVELQWLTTWGHDANDELRQLLDLPQLAVAGTYDDEGQNPTTEATGTAHASVAPAAPDPLTGRWWKYDVVARLMLTQPDRPILWVDDELHDARGSFRVWADRQAHVTAVGPNPRCGLSPQDLHEIEQVLTTHSRGGGALAAP